MKRAILIGIGMVILGAMPAKQSSAALLAAGDSVALSGTTTIAQPELAGLVIYDDLLLDSIAPSGNDLFPMGISVQNRVIQSTLNGNLIFAPRIIPSFNLTTGNFLVEQVVFSGFTDFVLDVNYKTDGLGDRGPNTASRSIDGDQLTFDFLFPLVLPNLFPNPIEESYFFSIDSNATAYTNTGSMSIFGRHLDYVGQTFEFTYTGIAVPITAQVSVPGLSAMFLSMVIGLFAVRTHRSGVHQLCN